MSRENTILSSENLQTVVAVCFVLSLLAVGTNFYHFTKMQRIEAVAVRAASVDVRSMRDDLAESRRELAALRDHVRALEAELAGLKAPAAAPPAAPTPAQ